MEVHGIINFRALRIGIATATLCLLVSLNCFAQHRYLPYDLGSNFQDIVETKDRKRAFDLPFDPYASETEQLSRQDALNRIRRFANTYLADKMKEKALFLEHTFSQSKTGASNSVSGHSSSEEASQESSFNYEVKYRLRGRRFRMEFNSNLINISGIAEISGRPRFEATKEFGDLMCRYIYYLDRNDQSFMFEKPLTANIRAATTLGIGSREQEADSNFQLFFNTQF